MCHARANLERFVRPWQLVWQYHLSSVLDDEETGPVRTAAPARQIAPIVLAPLSWNERPRALGEVQAADPTVASSPGLLVCARLDTGLRPPRGSRLNSSQDATDQRLGPPEEPLEALLQQTRGSGRG